MDRLVELTVAGESVEARGDRTLFWPAEKTLFVADLHLGKGTAFRAAGFPVPAGSTAATLSCLSLAVEETTPDRLVVLGDLWHARSGRNEENVAAFQAWRDERPNLETILVIGNHDRWAGLESDSVPPGGLLGPFALHHHPEPDPAGYVLSGHLHPSVRLSGAGRQSMRLPCFWFGEQVGVLPAFGDLTGTSVIEPGPADQIVVVAEGRAAIPRTRDRSESRWR